MAFFEITDLSVDERHTLARKVGISFIYLWQYGSGIRTPRLEVAEKLLRHEKRLTVSGLLAPKYRLQAKLKKTK
jgi:hypothetical protein